MKAKIFLSLVLLLPLCGCHHNRWDFDDHDRHDDWRRRHDDGDHHWRDDHWRDDHNRCR